MHLTLRRDDVTQGGNGDSLPSPTAIRVRRLAVSAPPCQTQIVGDALRAGTANGRRTPVHFRRAPILHSRGGNVVAAILISMLAVGCGTAHRTESGSDTTVTSTSKQMSSSSNAVGAAVQSKPSTAAPTNPLAKYGDLRQLRMITASDGWALTGLAVLRTTRWWQEAVRRAAES